MSSETDFQEAPTSATVKIKSTAGFEYMFTLRDEKASNLMAKIGVMEKKWLALGWTPVVMQPKAYPKKPVVYVEGRTCPKCNSKLVEADTKKGKVIKCETNKWNAIAKKAEGCDYIEWSNPTTGTQVAN